MYVIIKIEKDNSRLYLNKNKNLVAKLSNDAIFLTYSEAGNKARSITNGAKIISLKDFLLSDVGLKAFEEFCLTSLQ